MLEKEKYETLKEMYDYLIRREEADERWLILLQNEMVEIRKQKLQLKEEA